MFVVLIILLVGCPTVAFAYGDPVTTGWLFQLALPILVAASAVFSLARKHVERIVGRTRDWIWRRVQSDRTSK